ncbi:NifB/NifX family molybdenum-iron cluster-binding protein [Oceanithermus sp.]
MKLAIVTDDGRTVSQHFGRAAFYLVVETAGGEVKSRELRPRKTPHAAGHDHEHHHGHGHGTAPRAAERHAAMTEQIKDCELLVAGGMGQGAVRAMEEAGIRVVLTDLPSVDDVLRELAAGNLRNRSGRMH